VREIAEQLGISVATVSRAMNLHPDVSSATRARVLATADDLGYLPSVGKRPMNVIGLAYPTQPVRADYGNFESAMLAGMLRGINERSYDLKFINLERDHDPSERYTHFFRRKGIRGVIIRKIQPASDLAERIAADGFPVLLIADRSDDSTVNYIYCDSRADSARAIDHLVNLGHRRIALAVHAVVDSDHQDRLDGYRDALRRHGIDEDERLQIRAMASVEGGAFVIDRLLSLPKPPTAIYITDPLTTVGALHRCLQLGIRVPQELSIVGFDDGDVRYRTFPNYTAVCQDAEQLGLEAARWLTEVVDTGNVTALRAHRPTTLSINESTGVCPASSVRLMEDGTVRRDRVPQGGRF
jgi:DNA-binding LacI/PurR family transcriptional regulator